MASLHLSILFLSTIALSSLYGIVARDYKTHLQFYMHDIIAGPNATAIRVVKGPVNPSGQILNFGDIVVFDDALTAKPNPASTIIGRSQGFYIPASLSADPNNFALYLTTNIVFTQGKYNGSTISIVGRDVVFTSLRELSVVGGTGKFRNARGYVLWTTNHADTNGNAIVDLNVFIE